MKDQMTMVKRRDKVKFQKTRGHQIYKTSDGLRVPGVTTIINDSLGWNKRVLMAWQKRELLAGRDPDKVRDQAADIGTLTHFLVECHIKNVEPDTSEFSTYDIDKAETGFLGFLEWEDKYSPKYVSSEYQFVSDLLQYGGTIDTLAQKNGSIWMLDLKTSKGVYVDHKIQAAAYKNGYEDATGEKIDEVHILQLDKNTGAFNHHPIPSQDLDMCWLVFLHCKAIYDLKKLIDTAIKNGRHINPSLYTSIRLQGQQVYKLFKQVQ